MRYRPTIFLIFAALALPFSIRGGEINFSRDIRPILSGNCYFCHGPDEKAREAGLRLDDEVEAKKNHKGMIAIVPGKPEASELIKRIESKDPDEVMPPPKQHKVITPAQIALLKEWIKQGAPWGKHWSYEQVARPPVPQNGEKNPIDAFLAQRLDKEKLKFSSPADKPTLIRRVALDVIGLPPTLEELDTLAQKSHEQLVAHYIKKPAYGEHWARTWLDLARYADSAGYPSDPGRQIWHYRDWVVRALNSNMPFDQFTIEQLAGDLLPNPTDDQLTATAFHRNTMTNNEGGTSDEEFRVAAVIDRVNTTYAVWMGTTMACAQCHTHKYDPITIGEYYQSYAFLNQSADADKQDESPLHKIYTPELKQQRDRLQAEATVLESKFAKPDAKWLAGFDAWESGFSGTLRWLNPKPSSVLLESKSDATVRDDGTVSISKQNEKDSYIVDLPLQGEKLSALKLETFPAPGFGNFVITEIKAELIPRSITDVPVARFVRIELPGKKKTLQLAEVQVFSKGENVAIKGTAKQVSQYADAEAKRAIDGRTDGEYSAGSVAHALSDLNDPWWEVDLNSAQGIERVVVWNRTDGDTGKRLDGFRVVLLDDKRQLVWKTENIAAPDTQKELNVGGPVTLTFTAAIADYEQTGFTAASLLKPKDKTNKGWAVGGAVDKPHTLTLLAGAPVAIPEGAKLRVSIKQHSEHKQHTLGSFRVGFTGDAQAQAIAKIPAAVVTTLAQPKAQRTPAQQTALSDYYVRSVAKEPEPDRMRLASLTKELDALKPVTVPIMKDLDVKNRRKTQIQLRGNWEALGDVVTEGVPAIFPPLPKDAPRNRLTFARWLVSKENPLTARVTVNRLWESIFGTGIVRSSEEFGSQGDLPLHPELLDWLAAELVDKNWDAQHILTLILTSRAYQQISTSPPALTERDPDNRLLARGPRFRATGELLRDQALAVSGLLSPKMFGPAVRPLRPNLGLSTAFGGGLDWTTSPGEDRHRRSLYTETRRNSPYPSFATFDTPNREVCTIRRNRTNTPLQAFVTLNDPVFIETHQAFARRLVKECGADTAAKIRFAFKSLLARDPDEKDLKTVTAVYDEALNFYRKDAALAAKMATDPIGPAPGSDLPILAAWTVVANIMMNLDEFQMRR